MSSIPTPIPEIRSDDGRSPPGPAPQEDSPVQGRRLFFRRMVGRTARSTGLSLLDQTVVSGASFAATILIGRFCGQKELGLYSLGFSLLLIVLAALQTLVMTAYTIHSPSVEGRAALNLPGRPWRRA